LKKLSFLSVLALDCQATHNKPSSGHLVEIAWSKTQAVFPFDQERAIETAKSYLVKMGNTVQIPKQFVTMTGIEPAEMKEAFPKEVIWQKLRQEATKIKYENQGTCPAVIHFKKYEEPYLKQIHQEFAPKKKFPFTIICTHEIISRLYPGLPRKSLRAAAGFFGYSLPNFRRSLPHVVATAFIWNRLVSILEEQEKIITFRDLQDWLRHPPTSAFCKPSTREYPMEKAARQNLPDKPGIYKMYRSSGDLLYIGKAKSLKQRVNSYFLKKGHHAEHILEMLSQAQNLSMAVTGSALEAAVRESDEIKLFSPPYNRALQPKERQLYFYSDQFKSKQRKPDKHHTLGPFPSNIKMEALAKFIETLYGKRQKFYPRLIETLLGAPPGYIPDKDCFREGLEAFTKKYCQTTPIPICMTHIRLWGTEFWAEKLLEKEQEQQKKSIQDRNFSLELNEQEEIEEGWTPERVMRSLKRVVRIGTFQIRRARWFCRLSESTLAWSNGNDNDNPKHMLLIENSVPIFREQNICSNKALAPAGHKKTLLERQTGFDIAAYDRMRIVTTEMRRIVREGRNIELCFHPGTILKNSQLEKILRWV
jgi:DNA polymerase-3 subunit epsilon